MPGRPKLRRSRAAPELKRIRIASARPDQSGGIIRIKGRSGGELDIPLAPGGSAPRRGCVPAAGMFAYLPPFIKGARVEPGRIMLRSSEEHPFRIIILDGRDQVLLMRRAVRITGSDDLWQCAIPPGIRRCMRKFIVSQA
jgi:hypothetical protein